ncbi:MAG: Gx transporter family protein [Nitrospina sp.]|jgi:heptaprenyl diphosphate synthase|nr:Gx transporter family protein [Nitrospina sp.]MBT3509418.1 Gx transporter family protein [Nitrospina sp.]MBT3877031.1 Gx transporter family protein [Nitrospina sp.]MBT4048774.1 Gx transporter family protein [Nitrospina sp.]MBT4556173.1 Gx transporter family protein [Nitrospina sp.]
MLSPRTDNIAQNKRIVIMALMVALGVILHRLEAMLPLPTPWIKLGLANLMTLMALIYLGTQEAFIVTLVRVILGSILGGTFLGPTFFLSLAGGLASTAVMCGIYNRGKGPFSLIGISICGAYTHTFITAVCVYFFLIKQASFFILLPFFFSLALITGILTGITGNLLSRKIGLQLMPSQAS